MTARILRTYPSAVMLSAIAIVGIAAHGMWLANGANAYNDYGNPTYIRYYDPPFNVGIFYKWGSNLQSPTYLARQAFESSVSNWNNTSTNVTFFYSDTGENVFNTYYQQGGDAGYTVWYYSGGNLVRADALFNTSGFPTQNERVAVTGHELGHVIALGHSYANPSLMGVNPDPDMYFFPQTDDVLGVYDLYP